MKKKYKAIFFDWDGTAVLSRKAPVEDIIKVMKPLLDRKIHLVIVSGTTMENISGGKLAEYFTKEELEYLYLGLGRGALNYRYVDGQETVFSDLLPDQKLLSDIHRIAFDIHMELLETYGLNTDIVFSRPNYCKIDLMVDNNSLSAYLHLFRDILPTADRTALADKAAAFAEQNFSIRKMQEEYEKVYKDVSKLKK